MYNARTIEYLRTCHVHTTQRCFSILCNWPGKYSPYTTLLPLTSHVSCHRTTELVIQYTNANCNHPTATLKLKFDTDMEQNSYGTCICKNLLPIYIPLRGMFPAYIASLICWKPQIQGNCFACFSTLFM